MTLNLTWCGLNPIVLPGKSQWVWAKCQIIHQFCDALHVTRLLAMVLSPKVQLTQKVGFLLRYNLSMRYIYGHLWSVIFSEFDDHRCPFISHYSLLFIKLSIDDMMKLGPPFSWPPLQLSQEFLLSLCFISSYCLKSEAWKGNQQRHCLIFFRAEKILWFLVFLSQQIGDKTGQILRLIWFLKVVDSPRVWWSANDFQSGAKWCRVALDMGQLAQT